MVKNQTSDSELLNKKIKFNGDLNRLTIVVPTYKRKEFAIRFMNYWCLKEAVVIVLDGSPKSIDQSLFPSNSQNIRYIHQPVSFSERILKSLDLIKTEYVVLACDDEFYIPSAVSKCIKELDQDPELVACSGRALGFSFGVNSVNGIPVYPLLENYSINPSNGEERLVQHMGKYVPSLIFAVCRTDVWVKSFKYILKEEFSFFAAGELMFEMLVSYAGKSKVNPELMWLRSQENEPFHASDPNAHRDTIIVDWWANSTNCAEHEKFLSIMAEGFSTFSNQANELNEYRNSVVKGVEAYFEWYKERLGHNRVRRYIRGIAIRLIPEVFKKPLKSFLQKLRPNKSNATTELITAAQSLEASGVCVDFDELENIESVIREFHQCF